MKTNLHHGCCCPCWITWCRLLFWPLRWNLDLVPALQCWVQKCFNDSWWFSNSCRIQQRERLQLFILDRPRSPALSLKCLTSPSSTLLDGDTQSNWDSTSLATAFCTHDHTLPEETSGGLLDTDEFSLHWHSLAVSPQTSFLTCSDEFIGVLQGKQWVGMKKRRKGKNKGSMEARKAKK